MSFTKQIAPIFATKCLTCHNADKAKGHYLLENFESMMKAGESKQRPVVPAKPTESKLYQLITAADADDRMPQKADPLPAGQIALVEKWISQGAQFDGTNRATPFSVFAAAAMQVQTPQEYVRPVSILALAIRPEREELAASGYGEVTIWNPATGKLVNRIPQMPQKIQALAFSRDGAVLAVAGGSPGVSGEAILLRDNLKESDGPLPFVGTYRRSLGTFADIVLDLKFSSDEKRLAIAGADNSIRVYDVASGKQQLLIQQHADWVTAVAWRHDGKLIASSSRDRTCRIFDAATGELETTYIGHEAPVFSVAFNADDQFVCSGGRDKKIHIWSVKEGKKTNELAAADGEILRLVGDGERLFSCGSDKIVREYNLSDDELKRTYAGHTDWVYSLAIDPAHHRLATGDFNGEVRWWDSHSGELLNHFIAAPGTNVGVRQAQRH